MLTSESGAALLSNAKVYVLAEKYDIKPLKRLAAQKYTAILKSGRFNSSFSYGLFFESIKLMYADLPESDRMLKIQAVSFAHKTKELTSMEEFVCYPCFISTHNTATLIWDNRRHCVWIRASLRTTCTRLAKLLLKPLSETRQVSQFKGKMGVTIENRTDFAPRCVSSYGHREAMRRGNSYSYFRFSHRPIAHGSLVDFIISEYLILGSHLRCVL